MVKQTSISKLNKCAKAIIVLTCAFIYNHSYAFLQTITVGGGLSQTLLNIDINASGNSINAQEANLSQNYTGLGYGLGVSFDVYRWISFELMYNTLGSSKITSHNNIRESGDIEFQGTSMYAVYSYPNRNYGVQFHGKLGLFSLATNTNLSYVKQANDTGLSVAGSLSYFTRAGWGGQLNLNVHGNNLQIFSATFSRRFNLVTVETRLAGSYDSDLLDSNELSKPSSYFSEAENYTYDTYTYSSGNEISESTKDEDGDGISDDVDVCPGTPLGVYVDNEGCSTLNQEGSTLNNDNLIDNTLLYPDDNLSAEDRDIDLNLFGVGVDRGSPVSASTLRGLLGSINQQADTETDFDTFFGENQIESFENSRNNNNLSATDILGLGRNQSSNEGQNIFAETGKRITKVDYTLANVSDGILGLAGVDNLVEASTENPFRTIAQNNSIIRTQSTDEERQQIDNAFVSNINELKKEIQQKINAVNQESNNPQEGAEANFDNSDISVFEQANEQPNSDENIYELGKGGVTFEEGQSEISSSQQQNLQKLASKLRENRRNRIELRVWKQSAEEESESVAKTQVIQVRNFLLENGVSSDQIDNITDFEKVTLNSKQANRVEIQVIE